MVREIKCLWTAGIVVAGLSLGVSSPAVADWQYTKWGMTPEEVIAASGGAARMARAWQEGDGSQASVPRADGFVFLASAEYSAFSFNFHVQFEFTEGDERLAQVSLLLTDRSRCFVLKDALERRYGAPTVKRTDFVSLMTWHSQEQDDAIDLVVVGEEEIFACNVHYKPRLGPGSGL